MIAYVIKSVIVLSALYIPYMLMLRKESFFRFNRWILIGIMLSAIMLPLCNFHALSWGDSFINQGMIGIIEVGTPIYLGLAENKTGVTPNTTDAAFPLVADTQRIVFILSFVYLFGVLVILLWKAFQFVRLYRKIHRGVLWKDHVEGTTIYCHANDVAPFSWMHAIVISEKDYTNHAREIMRHELGHIHHHHSLDILLLNAIQLLQWINPFVWILGSSLRDVHEFEADDTVLKEGVDVRLYQTLLITKAIGSSSFAFANSFNHSLLKKRITMMLQKKSNPWMRTKALYIIPVALFTLSAFATPELNNPTATSATNNRTNVEEQLPVAEDTIAKTKRFAKTDNSEVLDVCEKLPEFKGGQEALFQFMMQNMRYPAIAQKCGVTGKVLVQFVIMKDGKVAGVEPMTKAECSEEDLTTINAFMNEHTLTELKEKYGDEELQKASRKALEMEAVRVVQMTSENWNPGEDKGKKVNVKFIFPVSFRFQ